MLVVERTDPSAAVAHWVDALNNSLGFAFTRNSLSAGSRRGCSAL